MYRNSLPAGHWECGVEVHGLVAGPIRNPHREVVEDHTKSSLLSKPGIAEFGGICKYVTTSEMEFCNFCKLEATGRQTEEKLEKERKRRQEIDYLMKNLDRIRGVQTDGIENGRSATFEEEESRKVARNTQEASKAFNTACSLASVKCKDCTPGNVIIKPCLHYCFENIRHNF